MPAHTLCRPGGRTALLRQAVSRAMLVAAASCWSPAKRVLAKTRLVDEVAAEAKASGIFVVRGHCYDMEGAPPYVPFVEAIEYGLTVTTQDAFRSAMGDAGPEIARFVPKVRVAYPGPAAAPRAADRPGTPLHVRERVRLLRARRRDSAAADRAGRPALGRRIDDATARERGATRRADAAPVDRATYRDVDLIPHTRSCGARTPVTAAGCITDHAKAAKRHRGCGYAAWLVRSRSARTLGAPDI